MPQLSVDVNRMNVPFSAVIDVFYGKAPGIPEYRSLLPLEKILGQKAFKLLGHRFIERKELAGAVVGNGKMSSKPLLYDVLKLYRILKDQCHELTAVPDIPERTGGAECRLP